MHLHLLGGGKARAEKLWEKIKEIDPTVLLTGDAATEVRNRRQNKVVTPRHNQKTPQAESKSLKQSLKN